MISFGIRGSALTFMMLFLSVFSPFIAARVEAQTPSFTFTTNVLNQYICRGAAQTKDGAVIQPSLGLTYGGWTVNVWGNLDTARHSDNPFMPLPPGQAGNAKWSETDFTASYTKELCSNFWATIGNMFYALQQPICPFDPDEVFGGVSYAFPWLTVAFTTYGEVTHTFDVWFQLDLTRSIPVDMLCRGAVLDLGASFGYLILLHDNNTLSLAGAGLNPPAPLDVGSYSNFQTARLTADIRFPIGQHLTVGPKVGIWLPLTDAAAHYLEVTSLDSKSTHVYGGINLTMTF